MTDLTDLSLEEIERAVDSNQVQIRIYTNRGMGPVKYWRVRRNGKTRLWKTRPDDYQIPVKAGLYIYAYITPTTLDEFRLEERDIRA
jgi:hypothetical protein